MCQWYFQPPLLVGISVFLLGVGGYLYYLQRKDFAKLKYAWLGSGSLFICILATGLLITYCNDIRHGGKWVGNDYNEKPIWVAVLKEPLVEKEKSYKTQLSLHFRIKNDKKQRVQGFVIAYFKKDDVNQRLRVGDQIVFVKHLQPIQNAGNPGAFDYKTYELLNRITHSVYLTRDDYRKISETSLSIWRKALFNTRSFVLNAIKHNIKGKREQGLAEAMLIGYRDDLDKKLLQSYSNVGVVHVIAVSGMHLALLYGTLHVLLSPLLRRRATKWLHPVVILFFLWCFSVIAGGAASVVRAAVMFTFITIGKLINRNTSTYNILAAGAFCQLCYHPYWLWDVGFQLSYLAVLSIVIFFKPIYDLLFIKNKILNWVWQLAAVSIAAQILTTPLVLYHFHQFPVYFLLSNLVVVPISSMVLVGTLIIVVFSPIKAVALFLGDILNGLIWCLNEFIERMDMLPYSIWENIQISTLQMFLLLMVIASISFWCIAKYKQGVWYALVGLLMFFMIRSNSIHQSHQQQKFIVYHIPKCTVADFVSGRNYMTIGDTAAFEDISIYTYTLKPSRTLLRVRRADALSNMYRKNNAFIFNGKKILWVRTPFLNHRSTPLEADVVVVSGNGTMYISDLLQRIAPRQIVIDGSVPIKKAQYWVRECNSLKIPCHNTATDGAFVMNFY